MQHSMDVMDRTGHTTVTWDPGNTAEVTAARATFDRMTREGYRAFRREPEKGGVQINSFDPDARSMVLVPQLVGG